MINYVRDKELEKKIVDYLVSKGATKIELFGSYVRGEEYNDIDVIVEFDKWPDLFEFVRYKMELESITGKKIDLIAGKESISKYILPYISNEIKGIYNER